MYYLPSKSDQNLTHTFGINGQKSEEITVKKENFKQIMELFW